MKLKDIFADQVTKVFVVTADDSDDELEWSIEPTDFETIPEEEGVYFVKAKEVMLDRTADCYLGIMTPERIAEAVIKFDENGVMVAESINDQANTVIPAVASESYGDYSLYYAKTNPQIGVDVLEEGLVKARNKNIVAQDLGYILRDEERFEEAIRAFKISEKLGPSSEYIYLELSRLYKRLGQAEKQKEYEQKFMGSGGAK